MILDEVIINDLFTATSCFIMKESRHVNVIDEYRLTSFEETSRDFDGRYIWKYFLAKFFFFLPSIHVNRYKIVFHIPTVKKRESFSALSRQGLERVIGYKK